MKRALLASALIAFSLPFLSVEPAAKEKWTRIRSQNFTVVGNGSEKTIRKVTLELEQFRQVVSMVLPRAKITMPIPTTVILFDGHSSFRPYKPKFKGKIQENIAGYFLPGGDENYIVLTAEANGGNPYEVIFHEYEHFILHNNVHNIPLWLNEGLAEYFSMFSATEDGKKARVGVPIGRHIGLLRNATLLPLKTLLAVDHNSPDYHESGRVGVFYAESWALVHYLMIGEHQKRQPQLNRFINQLNAGLTIEENFKQSFQADYAALEKELRDYIAKFTFPFIEYTFKEQLELEKNLQIDLLPEAQSEYYLGNLLLHQGRLDEAETHLQKSLQADTQFTSGQLAFSALRLRQRKPEEAKKYLPEITSREPNNYLGHFYTGQIALSEEKPEAAITSFRQAVKLKPDLAFLHAELGIALSNAGLEQEAATSFEQAARLDPDNSALYRTGSLTFLNLARGDKAARFAKLYLAREGWHATSSAYMAFVAYFGYRQMKSSAAAEEMLKSLVEKGDTQSWPYPVVQYLQRQLSAEQLLKLAKDNDELTEAHAYLGMDLSLAGNREEALTHLYWVRDHGNKGFTEYPMSLAEIKRLESKGK